MTALEEGRLDTAATHFEEVLRHVPQDLNTLTALARLSMYAEHADAAFDYVQRAVAALKVMPIAPMLSLMPGRDLLEVTESVKPDAVPAIYAEIQALVQAGVAAISSVDKADRLSQVVLSLCEIADDPALMQAYFRKRLPDFTGIALPMIISPATSVREWCGAKQRFLELDKAEDITVTLGSYARRYASPGFHIGIVPQGEMVCGWDFAVTPRGEVLFDSSYHLYEPILAGRWFPHKFDDKRHRCFHLWPEQSDYIDADVVFLSPPPSFALGHWLCDMLPRLRTRSYPGLEQVKVAIPAELPKKHRDLLALCGVPEADIIECTLTRRYRFRNLIVAQAGPVISMPPNNAKYLASRFGAPPAPGARRRIFLSRTEETRKILNEDEMTARLQSLGFEFMNLAKTPIAEQQSRLAQADIVIGVYGSDLLACFFMQAGSHLIALDYYGLVDPVTGARDSASAGIHCTVLGIHFQVLDCSTLQRDGAVSQKKDRDFAVDCDALAGMIGDISAGQK